MSTQDVSAFVLFGGPRRCGGKNRAWEVAPMFRPEKAKSWPLIVVWSVFGRVVAALVALTLGIARTLMSLL